MRSKAGISLQTIGGSLADTEPAVEQGIIVDDRARPIADVDVRVSLADLCRTASEEGKGAARRMATAQLVAAAAYLEDQVGVERTVRILTATIASIGTGETKKH